MARQQLLDELQQLRHDLEAERAIVVGLEADKRRLRDACVSLQVRCC